MIDAGKELIEKCEDLYERRGELVEDATHALSGKYRALHDHTKQLLDEAETILRRAKGAAIRPVIERACTAARLWRQPAIEPSSSVYRFLNAVS